MTCAPLTSIWERENKHSRSSLTNDDFYSHFKGLVECESSDNTGYVYDITNTEMRSARLSGNERNMLLTSKTSIVIK